MIIRKAFKYRLNLTPEQRALCTQFAGINRFVWNKALALNLSRLNEKQPILWFQESNWLTQLWKKSDEYAFLKDAPSQTLQQTLKQLERAFKDGFDKKQPLKRMPVFKRKGKQDSFRLPQGFKLEGKRLFLPKLGWTTLRLSRDIKGTPKNCTITRQGQHWFVSIQTEQKVVEPVHSSTSMIGIDMGVKRLITLSNGEYEVPIDTQCLQHKIKKYQRQLARKVKFSNNWKKLNAKVNHLHMKIAAIRHDRLHKLTTTLSQNHAMIVLEDLQIRNMTKSAKGNAEQPGRKVSQKAGLNRVILEQGWGKFKTLLEYKQQWAGGQVIYVHPAYTSQTCPACAHRSKDNRLTQADFHCVQCHYENNADVVGAINIERAGHAQLACVSKGIPFGQVNCEVSGQQQEPKAA